MLYFVMVLQRIEKEVQMRLMICDVVESGQSMKPPQPEQTRAVQHTLSPEQLALEHKPNSWVVTEKGADSVTQQGADCDTPGTLAMSP